MYTVHGDRSVETAVYRTALHIAAVHIALHVEMDGVATKTERLARVRHLDMVEMRHSQSLIFLIRMNHDLDPELVAPPLVTVAPLKTGLRLKLVWIELLGTCFDLAIPSLVKRAPHHDVTGKQAHLLE